MPDSTAQEVREKLLAGHFTRAESAATTLADPIADTPRVVTLDELRPYELNPRVTRNPLYEDLKASIRERGLDAPPAITRRPGESHFIIRNGGNTRLSILRELWTETKDEKFFRIYCLFRPWSARGEIVALTGHLAENELHGSLSFIERALGVEKARELYEAETGKPLSQRELARRLTTDGYPVNHSLVSRMQEAVQFLLPAIPSVLYAGLGKPQIERLIALRKAAARCWARHVDDSGNSLDVSTLFAEVLAPFDEAPQLFHVQRVQDELVGKLSEVLKTPYSILSLEMVDAAVQQDDWNRGSTQPTVNSTPAPESKAIEKSVAKTPSSERVAAPTSVAPLHASTQASLPQKAAPAPRARPDESTHERNASPADLSERLQAHIVSPAETTDRLRTIQHTIAQATGDRVPDFESNVVQAIPVQAGGLFPIADVWYIEPALDVPDRLRIHIAQLAVEIAEEATLADRIEGAPDGIGFVCMNPVSRSRESLSAFQRAVLTLLHGLSAPYATTPPSTLDGVRLIDDIGTLLQGMPTSRRAAVAGHRLSDAGIVKLFRLIRLARRLLELERESAKPNHAPA